MIKQMLILTIALVLGISGIAFAGAKVLSDSALDGVSAGDWVVLNDNTENAEVVDVYSTNNTLWLLENSQKDINALSNENAIDAATAVQSNVARVTGDTATENVEVNGANTANISNYRPSYSTANKQEASFSSYDSASVCASKEANLSDSFSLSDTAAASSSVAASYSRNYFENETLDVLGSLSGSSSEISKYGISGNGIAGSLVVDGDKIVTDVESAGASAAASCSKATLINKYSQANCSSEFGARESAATKITCSKEANTSDSKGVNNHILLTATSQQSIKAVSNLNAVGAGAAVQNNIASNVGVSGMITHTNNASVSNGLNALSH